MVEPLPFERKAASPRRMDFRGKWVIVTGASAGLGQEMARQLAVVHGANLIITARRLERLEALKTELETKAKVQVVCLAGDMAVPADVERLCSEALQGRTIYAAILNAGVTHFGHHHELNWADFQAMLQTNVIATVRMCTELLKHFEETKGTGGVMLVSSLAGQTPVPYQSAYSGTKGFLNAYGTAVAHEIKRKPYSITTFAPGGIQTEMTSGDRFSALQKWLAPVSEVAAEGLSAMADRQVLAVPGMLNRLGLFAFRFLPRNFVIGQLETTYRKALNNPGSKK